MNHRLIDELVLELERLARPGGPRTHDSVLHALQEVSLAAEAFSMALTCKGSVTQSQAAFLAAQELVARARGVVQRALALEEQVRALHRPQ